MRKQGRTWLITKHMDCFNIALLEMLRQVQLLVAGRGQCSYWQKDGISREFCEFLPFLEQISRTCGSM